MTWENRLTFEVSSADPDSTSPAWVDLTLRIRDALQPVEIASGRQNDLDATEPGVFAILLDNSDDALTYGSTSSPYAAWWGPGRKCRLRETVAGVVMDLATGYLQVPTETIVTAGIEQRVSVSIVDRLGRLQASEPFISTLTEHIQYTGGSSLIGYWTLLGASRSFSNVGSQSFPDAQDAIAAAASGVVATDGASKVVPNGAPSVLADDGVPVLLSASTGNSGTQVAVSPTLRVTGFAYTVPAAQVLTLVGWYRPTMPSNKAATLLQVATSQADARIVSDATGTLSVTVIGPLTASFSMKTMPDQAWVPLAIQLGWDTGLIEAWVGRDRYTGVLAGVPVGTNFLGTIGAATFYTGGVAHLQCYAGTASTFTNAMFIDQYAAAQNGLERQTTGDRIRTIAAYAGIPTAEYTSTVDTGSSVMQRATLAGQTPLQAMRDAERTEQGLLYVDGSGNLVFKDRRTLYNI